MVLIVLFFFYLLKFCVKFSLNLLSCFREGDGNLEKLMIVLMLMIDIGYFFLENFILLLVELWYILMN